MSGPNAKRLAKERQTKQTQEIAREVFQGLILAYHELHDRLGEMEEDARLVVRLSKELDCAEADVPLQLAQFVLACLHAMRRPDSRPRPTAGKAGKGIAKARTRRGGLRKASSS